MCPLDLGMSCFYFPFLPLRVLSSLGVDTQFLWKLGRPLIGGFGGTLGHFREERGSFWAYVGAFKILHRRPPEEV